MKKRNWRNINMTSLNHHEYIQETINYWLNIALFIHEPRNLTSLQKFL
jgi:hypothetical protein